MKMKTDWKTGDRCWFFRCDGDILSATITEIDEDCIRGDCDALPVRVIIRKEYPIFPTREALCEYYRKIFE